MNLSAMHSLCLLYIVLELELLKCKAGMHSASNLFLYHFVWCVLSRYYHSLSPLQKSWLVIFQQVSSSSDVTTSRVSEDEYTDIKLQVSVLIKVFQGDASDK